LEEQQEIQGHRDLKVIKENLVYKEKVEYQERVELLGPLDLVEYSESLVKLVYPVQMDHKVIQVRMVIQDLLVHLDLKAIVE